jgi:glycosyltransferase involved in cell wall biosynthesis
MLQEEHLVSIIIPVYNCERYLAEAIESALAQTYHPIEIIVVNDGSTDNSADVAKSFFDSQVRYCYQPNSGQGAARNQGVNVARGDFLAFLDADDVWLADKSTLQMAAFESNPELDMVLGHVNQFRSPELDVHPEAKADRDKEVMPGYLPGAMLIKRESFFLVGPFATHWRVGEFIDWYSKAMEKGLKSFTLPEVVMRRRIHNANMGIRERSSQTDYVRILKAALDRRREKDTQGELADTKQRTNE